MGCTSSTAASDGPGGGDQHGGGGLMQILVSPPEWVRSAKPVLPIADPDDVDLGVDLSEPGKRTSPEEPPHDSVHSHRGLGHDLGDTDAGVARAAASLLDTVEPSSLQEAREALDMGGSDGRDHQDVEIACSLAGPPGPQGLPPVRVRLRSAYRPSDLRAMLQAVGSPPEGEAVLTVRLSVGGSGGGTEAREALAQDAGALLARNTGAAAAAVVRGVGLALGAGEVDADAAWVGGSVVRERRAGELRLVCFADRSALDVRSLLGGAGGVLGLESSSMTIDVGGSREGGGMATVRLVTTRGQARMLLGSPGGRADDPGPAAAGEGPILSTPEPVTGTGGRLLALNLRKAVSYDPGRAVEALGQAAEAMSRLLGGGCEMDLQEVWLMGPGGTCEIDPQGALGLGALAKAASRRTGGGQAYRPP